MKSKVIIATHKPYAFPENELYIPIHVGRALSTSDFGCLGDDTGVNISEKNPFFCELTALYWAWKNGFFEDVDYCGLVHYRRYFKGSLHFGKTGILAAAEIEKHMRTYDVILPVRRNYLIETIRTHYAHAHYEKDLDMTRKILAERSPEFLDAFDAFLSRRKLHLYNMFVMPVGEFKAYMTWLFGILFELENYVDINEYDDYQKRIYGFIAERLLNVWVLQRRYRVKTLPVAHLEGSGIAGKIVPFLKRKFMGGDRT